MRYCRVVELGVTVLTVEMVLVWTSFTAVLVNSLANKNSWSGVPSSSNLGALGNRFGEKIRSQHLGIDSMLDMMGMLLETSIISVIQVQDIVTQNGH